MTLSTSRASSSGRLERQSDTGTVAIRELTAAGCQEVAEGLALSLELALEPTAHDQPLLAGETPTAREWQALIGGSVSVETGIAGTLSPGAALFAELAARDVPVALRFSARGARASRQGVSLDAESESEGLPDDVVVRATLLAARAEVCASLWRGSLLSLAPCLGAESGALLAESPSRGGESDAGFWAAGVGHVRASWHLGEQLSVEAQVGGIIPLLRYELRSELGRTVAESEPAGLQVAAGASWLFGS